MPLPIWPAPTMPSVAIFMPPPSIGSDPVDRHAHGVPAAEAERRNPLFFVAILERVAERRQNPRAGRADRMAESHGTPADVVLGGVQAEHPAERDLLDRKRLVELVQIDAVGRPARLLPEHAHGF